MGNTWSTKSVSLYIEMLIALNQGTWEHYLNLAYLDPKVASSYLGYLLLFLLEILSKILCVTAKSNCLLTADAGALLNSCMP